MWDQSCQKETLKKRSSKFSSFSTRIKQVKISFKNLRKIANEVGENLNDDEIKEMIGEADRSTHKEGLIDFEDFYRVMKKNCDDPLGEFDSDEDDEGVYAIKNNKMVITDKKNVV